jgi:hypothetical protein
VDISTEDFRKHFASLTDEALLEQPREALVPSAQACLDAELASRRLQHGANPLQQGSDATDAPEEDEVVVADFATLSEAEVAQGLLEAEGIPSTLSHVDTTGLQTPAANGVDLLVLASLAPRAQAILQQGIEISDEELAAQAEAAGLEFDADPDRIP